MRQDQSIAARNRGRMQETAHRRIKRKIIEGDDVDAFQ